MNNTKKGISATFEVNNNGHLEIGQLQIAEVINNNVIAPRPVAQKLPKIWNAPLENRQFFARSVTNNIQSRMQSSSDECQIALVAMSGLGGVGKTELAKNYFHHPIKDYTAKLWIMADSYKHLELEFRLLAQSLHLVDKEADIELVIRVLHSFFAEHSGWLLVFDNADDNAVLQPFIPAQGGDVLITSRQHIDNVEIIEVDVLESDQALLFYQKLSGKPADADGESLVAALGYLPLAIAQAAAYVKHVKNLDTKDYLERFNKFKQDILSTNKLPVLNKAAQTRVTIMTTWNLSLDAIEAESQLQNNKSSYARELLIACAYLVDRNIPETLLLKWIKQFYKDQCTELDLDSSLHQLSNHSLIQWAGSSIHMHKLLQEVIRMQNPLDIKREGALVYALDKESIAQNDSDEEQNRCFRLIPHLEALIKYEYQGIPARKIEGQEYKMHQGFLSTLLKNTGLLNYKQGLKRNAEKILQKKLIIEETSCDLDEIILFVSTLFYLGRHYIQQKNFERACLALESALVILQVYGAEDDIQMLHLFIELSIAFHADHNEEKYSEFVLKTGRFIKKSKIMDMLNKNNKINYQDDAGPMTNINNIYMGLRRLEIKHASEKIAKAFAITEQIDNDSESVMSIMLSLAKMFPNIYSLIEKHESLERTLTSRKVQYGDNHPETAIVVAHITTNAVILARNSAYPRILKECYLTVCNHPEYGRTHPYAKQIEKFAIKCYLYTAKLELSDSINLQLYKYLQALQWLSESEEYICNLSNLLEKNKAYISAHLFLQVCLNVHPNKFLVLLLIGKIKFYLKMYEHAFDAYLKAWLINSDVFPVSKLASLKSALKSDKKKEDYLKTTYDSSFQIYCDLLARITSDDLKKTTESRHAHSTHKDAGEIVIILGYIEKNSGCFPVIRDFS